MRAVASTLAPELARRLPVPKGAETMLDIGGSRGYYSVTLCRRHPGLRAVVLDPPEAVAPAAPLLAAEGMATASSTAPVMPSPPSSGARPTTSS